LLVVSLALIAASCASAQTTLVSNLAHTTGFDYRAVGVSVAGDSTVDTLVVGESFTTGNSAVSVSKFALYFEDATTSSAGPSGFELNLYSAYANGVGPSGWVATFTGSAPNTQGEHDFTGSAVLSANTTYYLIASAPTTSSAGGSASFNWMHTSSSAEDASAAGWSIGDTVIAQNSDFPNWTNTLTGSMVLAVEGQVAVPEPATYAAVLGAAGLALAALRRVRQNTYATRLSSSYGS
jgi:hypothetical protein